MGKDRTYYEYRINVLNNMIESGKKMNKKFPHFEKTIKKYEIKLKKYKK